MYAPASIMPSRPILNTPAFSEICSPRPASSNGTPAVTAPNSSETRKGSVNKAFMFQAACRLRRRLIQIFDQGQEQQQQRHQHQHIVLRHADPARGALAAHHQRREKQREADDGVAVEAREKHQRHDQQPKAGFQSARTVPQTPRTSTAPARPIRPALRAKANIVSRSTLNPACTAAARLAPRTCSFNPKAV